MQHDPLIYNELNKAWKSTCRILFGEEIGELKDYEEWLKEYMPVIGKRKSYVSGKEITLAMGDYCDKAKFISLDEYMEKAVEPLSINEIKDIDSIVEAISEKWEYVGDKVLGSSSHIESSDLVVDSHYVSGSIDIQKSQYVFSSALMSSGCKYIFGSLRVTNGEFLIRFMRGSNINRCFETREVGNSSDLYVCSNITGCHDLLFCFNQRNKAYCIGNLQLPKDKYLSLKKKLHWELAEEIRKNRGFPSIFELVPNVKPGSDVTVSAAKRRKYREDIKVIEKAFSSTFKVILRKEPESVTQYEDWLAKHIGYVKKIQSPFGLETYVLPDDIFPIYSLLPDKRTVSLDEIFQLSDLHLNENEIMSLEKIRDNIIRIGYFTDEFSEGTNSNIIKTPVAFNASNTYKVQSAIDSENLGLTSLVVGSKYVFGCRITDSQFCIKCYNSSNLTRCFEMDVSMNCSDSYFCHNSEGLYDAMFCFNTKGKKFVIGNSQLSPDRYKLVKDSLIEQMAGEILKKKELKWDIFNVGCGKIR